MTAIPPLTPAAAEAGLTVRQWELLLRVAQGATYRQVASGWGIAEITVRGYGHRLMRALGASTIAHAVHLAHSAGLLRPERHGDHPGYNAHLRRGEDPCERCRAGERVYRNAQRAGKAAA